MRDKRIPPPCPNSQQQDRTCCMGKVSQKDSSSELDFSHLIPLNKQPFSLVLFSVFSHRRLSLLTMLTDKPPEGGREDESYLQANVAPGHFNLHLQKTRLGRRERKETFPAGESKNMPDQPQKGHDHQQQHQGLTSTSSSPAQNFTTSPSPCAHWEDTPTYTSPTKANPASRAKDRGQKDPLLEDDEYYTQLMDTNS